MNKTVAFNTLGCKLNFAESSQIYSFFKEKGFKLVPFSQNADFYVINTCTVTSNANKKSRNAIQRAISKNNNAIIIVTGCYTQTGMEELKKIDGIDYIFGANDKEEIKKIIDHALKFESPVIKTTEHNEMKTFFPAVSQDDRTRTFLKIQDGCDYFCSYCTIPYARGRSRNMSIKNVLQKIEEEVEKGTKEIILTGVNIGDFGKSTSENFYNLLKAIVKQNKIPRLRIGSIEPDLLIEDIIKLVADSEIIMPHFHIPLQSGDNELLKIMKRKYTAELFKNRIDNIRKYIPDAFIGIDLIVGMNGETNEIFERSYNFVKSLDISYIHYFQYSERKGTPALNFTPKISSQIKNERAKLINQLCEEKNKKFLKKNIGKTQKVLFEAKKKNEKIFGFTENYIRVSASFKSDLINKIITVRLKDFDFDNDCMNSEII
ncbi:MAG TPA: tRNA (N(6)-L-threonylcarbamoyladenosine(37)-C(2))-methylthiotransferase MtaB [Bacteroidales bacterium]|nr:tRNA (N(6)-L-threonylcarbamoyladenosine(37)-C(2))-methylthiotransferase MtaB [Bacteroidales bacterium]HOL97971.1 tRNA (N(6)-L-threonylcarbamoyladenosine(37)-C(2))-methylthiotransferase MtaB [Bacteroidales bacterium]HOM36354.1 tRNA (N(6)-L-threonylcarbamoyladenosine(37)-C(2))-methylthiotransferase MtaB [Bacteroidales bacterium]HPD23521.1 tRNA (N(6)-L-threonylcarbamoyladenosine(37)-C(2))-methylthiotransferase MtaB [Bacteroidales bacterium]HRS99173.1 tRNA (N(6)-L-threonylcarbamoyladenosine(37)-